MIHIQRGPRPPSLRRPIVSNARRSLSVRVATNPTAYTSRASTRATRTLDFNARYYGHADIKRTLETMQHGKCAFCESKIKHIAHGDVEHFRPKAGWKRQVRVRGRVTIQELGLRRPQLRDRRRERYNALEAFFTLASLSDEVADVLDPDLSRAIDAHQHKLSTALDDSSEYAAMTRAAIGARFRTL